MVELRVETLSVTLSESKDLNLNPNMLFLIYHKINYKLNYNHSCITHRWLKSETGS